MQRDQRKGLARRAPSCRERGVNAFGWAGSLVGSAGDKAKGEAWSQAAALTFSSCRKALPLASQPLPGREVKNLGTKGEQGVGTPQP